MKTTWIVVADEGVARILEWSATKRALELVDELTDAAAHAHNADLRRDAEGRRAGGAPAGASGGAAARQRGGSSTTSTRTSST